MAFISIEPGMPFGYDAEEEPQKITVATTSVGLDLLTPIAYSELIRDLMYLTG